MSQIDLVLIHPASREEVYQSLATDLAAIEPPEWAALIATFIRQKGHSVGLIDAEALGYNAQKTAEAALALNPKLVAVVVYGHQPSASTQSMPGASRVVTALKDQSREVPVLLVGGHVAALPQRTLLEEDADFVAGGEGPHTILELLEALKSGRPDYAKVHGLWYQEGAKVYSTPPAKLVENLDQEMPQMAWDLLPMEKYRAHNWHCFGFPTRQPYAALYTTLGCPYHCTFCCIQAPFKTGEKLAGFKEATNSYRYWSPKNIVDQIGHLVEKYGVKHIKIADEMFVLSPKHVLAICDLIIERGYQVNIWAYARVDTVRDNMLDKLKKAGFNWLAFGIESGSERVRDNVDKSFDEAEIRRVIKRVQDAGINIIGNYIFGLPEDDMESMQATLDLALDLNCEFANFYSTMAYPGSPLYQEALEKKWELPANWNGYSQHAVDTLPLRTKYLTAAEVLRFRDEAFQKYFQSPKYLDMVAKKFGSQTAQHIRDMASRKLVRKFA